MIVFIRHFLNTCILYVFVIYKNIFIVTVIQGPFYATNRGNQWGDCNMDRNVLIFFKDGQLLYVIFKSYPSLLKFPESMTLGVLKHDYSTPALNPPSWLLNHPLHNFNETTSSHQIHMPLTPPEIFSFSPPLFPSKFNHLYLLQVFLYFSKLW